MGYGLVFLIPCVAQGWRLDSDFQNRRRNEQSFHLVQTLTTFTPFRTTFPRKHETLLNLANPGNPPGVTV